MHHCCVVRMAISGRSLKQVDQLWWQEYSHGSCPSRAWTRPRCRPCRPWCERWPARICELRMFHLEERRNCSHVTLIVFGNSDRRQLHPISFCSCSNFAFLLTDFNIFRFKIFRSAVRIFLFFRQGKTAMHAQWEKRITFSTFSIHSAIFWWRMS